MKENIQSSELRDAPADETPRGAPDVTALTRAMLKGDEMAYRAFYDAYFDRLLRYLLVVARVVRHVKVFDAEEKFWSWLTVLARRAFADERKKNRRYFSFLERFTSYSKVQSDGANEIQTDERLQNLLRQKIASLPPDEQQLIEQKYFAHRAIREIAEEMQLTEKAVESKLSRIRKKLKDAALAGLDDEK